MFRRSITKAFGSPVRSGSLITLLNFIALGFFAPAITKSCIIFLDDNFKIILIVHYNAC